jgi:phosphoribosylformimino-5-aminoimidazole carboxamide ribotide isomerase
VDVIAKITRAVSIPVEVGGGLRTDDDVRRLLDAGVARAIIGTRACADPDALGALVAEHGARVAVGIDARDGRVQVKGWVETTELRVVDLATAMERLGVQTLIVTDTATDGMLQGANVAGIDAVCAAVACGVIASGGVSSPDDVEALVRLRRPNLIGAIVGKALYEGLTTLAALNACLSP